MLATGSRSVHTSKHVSQVRGTPALIGMLLLTVLLIVGFITDILNLSQGLIPAKTMLAPLIDSFAALTVTVFFYVFHKAQP